MSDSAILRKAKSAILRNPVAGLVHRRRHSSNSRGTFITCSAST